VRIQKYSAVRGGALIRPSLPGFFEARSAGRRIPTHGVTANAGNQRSVIWHVVPSNKRGICMIPRLFRRARTLRRAISACVPRNGGYPITPFCISIVCLPILLCVVSYLVKLNTVHRNGATTRSVDQRNSCEKRICCSPALMSGFLSFYTGSLLMEGSFAEKEGYEILSEESSGWKCRRGAAFVNITPEVEQCLGAKRHPRRPDPGERHCTSRPASSSTTNERGLHADMEALAGEAGAGKAAFPNRA